jgi:hypothetical protein
VATVRRYFHSKCAEVPLPLDARLAAMMSFSSAERNLQRSGESGKKKKTRGERRTVAIPSRMKILHNASVRARSSVSGPDAPTPAGESRFAAEVINSKGQQAAECSREDADDIEGGDATLQLFAGIPIANERQCGGEES